MFQAYNLFPHMRVIDNVTLGAVRGQEIPVAEAREAGLALLARFGLEARARDYPDQPVRRPAAARRDRARDADPPAGAAAR